MTFLGIKVFVPSLNHDTFVIGDVYYFDLDFAKFEFYRTISFELI